MRHITYTTCFDEVLTAVVPNLPDQSSLAYTVPRPPRSAEAGGDYLCGFNELRRLLAFLCSDARPSGSRPGEFRASDDPGPDHGGGSRRPADRGACVLDQHGSCALASAGEMSCVYPLSRPWPRKRSKLSLPSGIVRSRPERTAFAQGLPTAAARSLDRRSAGGQHVLEPVNALPEGQRYEEPIGDGHRPYRSGVRCGGWCLRRSSGVRPASL